MDLTPILKLPEHPEDHVFLHVDSGEKTEEDYRVLKCTECDWKSVSFLDVLQRMPCCFCESQYCKSDECKTKDWQEFFDYMNRKFE